MYILVYLIVAALIGWVATDLMNDRSNLILNMIIAVLGAFLAGYFSVPSFTLGRSIMPSPFPPC